MPAQSCGYWLVRPADFRCPLNNELVPAFERLLEQHCAIDPPRLARDRITQREAISIEEPHKDWRQEIAGQDFLKTIAPIPDLRVFAALPEPGRIRNLPTRWPVGSAVLHCIAQSG